MKSKLINRVAPKVTGGILAAVLVLATPAVQITAPAGTIRRSSNASSIAWMDAFLCRKPCAKRLACAGCAYSMPPAHW